jgi:hypothetical protein
VRLIGASSISCFGLKRFRYLLLKSSETIQGAFEMIDLAVAAVFARELTEEQFEAVPRGRSAPRRRPGQATTPQAPRDQAQPAAAYRQSWLRRLASPAS